ncbi:hypothetical protein HYT02_05060 [Candidatus Gottesmanbacteria bacterium]|nr:hypothetical protein [Candidatus Gottesmanbacteria bacterium]
MDTQINKKKLGIFSFLSLKKSKLPNIENMSKFNDLKFMFANMPFSLPIRIYFILLAISFIILGFTFKKLPPLTPLFYSLPWGEEQLVRSSQLFIIPFSEIMVFITNIIISILFTNKDKFLTLLILWTNCFYALLALITLTKIIFLII